LFSKILNNVGLINQSITHKYLLFAKKRIGILVPFSFDRIVVFEFRSPASLPL